MSEESIKKNIEIVSDYFEGIKKLYSDFDFFKSESITAIRQKVALVKIYGLSFNLAWSLRYAIDRMMAYKDMLSNTLLYDYWEDNNKTLDDFRYAARELEDFINRVIEPLSISVTGEDRIEKEMKEGEGDEEIKLLIEDNNYLLNLSQDLASNGPKILHVISFYLQHARKLLVEIRNIRLNRTDSEYTLLFEREFKEFLTTDEWNDLSESFVNTTITMKFRGTDPTKDQLYNMRDDEFTLMTELRKELGQFDAYLSDSGKLARHIINKEIRHNVNNPIMELFGYLGRINLIDRWITALEEELPLMESFEGESPSAALTFSARLSEKRLKSLLPKIEELFGKRNAIDWICLYHVLVYRNYISCDDFKLFARWLNQAIGRIIISDANIRQIKLSYWAKEAKRMWTIKGLHEWRNTAKADNQYRDFEMLCDNINEIIK